MKIKGRIRTRITRIIKKQYREPSDTSEFIFQEFHRI